MYNHTNNSHATFANPVSESSTTFILGGTFDTLPTSNFILKCSKYSGGVLVGRENVLVTTRTGATCAGITRAFEAVPITDSTNALVQQALPFSAGDLVECVVSSAFVDEILQSYRNSLTPNSVSAINASGVEVALAGVANHVVGFNGSGQPTTFSPTVDINGLTAETLVDTTDSLVFYDASAGVNKKITREDITESLIFTNGSSLSISTAGSGPGTWVSSETAVLSKSTIGIYIASVSNQTATLQMWDGASWISVYSDTGVTSSNITFFTKPNRKYRCHLTSATGGSSGNISLNYTA